jgi:carbamoyl-phosphate synthase large subunit
MWSGGPRYLTPAISDPSYPGVLRGIVRKERIDLVVPTTDGEVETVSNLRDDIPGKCFLPDRDVIRVCGDKAQLTGVLRGAGVPAPETHLVTDLERLDSLFSRFNGRIPLWCRPRTGSCARGAAAVSSPEEAREWIRLWERMRHVPAGSFTLCEYLPGRDFLCQSLWLDGEMVLTNTFERLAYFGVDNIPSGITSLSSLAKTVADPRLVDVCRAAVRAVAPSASGAFSIDLKENAAGEPLVTEINAGRLFMAMTAFDRVLKHNMTLTYLHLALGEPVDFREQYDGQEGSYMVRDLDALPGIFHVDELFEEIHET